LSWCDITRSDRYPQHQAGPKHSFTAFVVDAGLRRYRSMHIDIGRTIMRHFTPRDWKNDI